jgi:hypothetical protein
MKKYLILLQVIALLSLYGCANSSFFEPTPITKPGNAMVYIYRPAATNPGKKPLTLSYPEVMIDGKSAGFLKYKKYLAVEVPPGQHEFLVTGLTREARWEPKDNSLKLEVEPGQNYFLRFQVEFNVAKMSLGTFTGQYIINLTPVSETDAVYEIRHTSNTATK